MLAAADPLDLNLSDVLRLIHIADQSVRAHDITHMQDRLSVTDVLGHFDEPDMVAYYDNTLTQPAACIAAFVGRCQQRGLWDWCQQVMSFAGMDATSIANAAAARVSARYAGWCHDVPVATICLYPDAYRFVVLTDLPYGHALGGCGYQPRGGNNEYRDTELRLSQGTRKSFRDRIFGGSRQVPPQEVWSDIQHRVESRKLDPCTFHTPPVDWALINDAAQHILEQTPFSVAGGVKKWDYRTANDYTYDAAHSYEWEGHAADRMRVVLRSLFNDPITWQPGFGQMSNGQHRICTLRHAGATSAFIVDAERHDDLHRRWQASTLSN